MLFHNVKLRIHQGIGNFYVDYTDKKKANSFEFKISYVKKIESEILANEELTSKEDFNLQEEVQNRLKAVLEATKTEVREEVKEVVKEENGEG